MTGFQSDLRGRAEEPLMLVWTCQECGWKDTLAAPGFAGDGIDHFPDGRTPCGPITAQRDVRYWSPVDPQPNAFVIRDITVDGVLYFNADDVRGWKEHKMQSGEVPS